MTHTIRPLQVSDKARWRELFDGYLEFYETSVPEDTIELTFDRLIGDGEWDHHGLVAVDDEGKLQGLTHYVFHRSTWSKTVYCYLEDLFVDKEVRGGGVGALLIKAVYAAADKKGATRTYWNTQEFNYKGRMLYDKMGVKSAFIQYRRPV